MVRARGVIERRIGQFKQRFAIISEGFEGNIFEFRCVIRICAALNNLHIYCVDQETTHPDWVPLINFHPSDSTYFLVHYN